MSRFEQIFSQSRIILTEGGVVERIRRDPSVKLDPFIAHAGLIYDPKGKKVLEAIYREYMDVGRQFQLPFLSLAPTWRANPERIEKSDFSHLKTINQDCVHFLKTLRKEHAGYASAIFIGGLMACRGDAYRPEEALTANDAVDFHRVQARQLAESGVDLIKAATLPAFSESYGMAAAISSLNIPYILSFVVNPDGTILDGTPLNQAIEQIDRNISPAPLLYMINCVHPSIFERAMTALGRHGDSVGKRLLGLQANTSPKSPEELDNLSYLDTTDPGEFGKQLASLHQRFGTKILGGCCGSDSRHIFETARSVLEGLADPLQ